MTPTQPRFHSQHILLWLAFLLLPSCRGEGPTGESGSTTLSNPGPVVVKRNADFVTTVTLSPSQVLREIPSTLFGTNIEWFQSGNGILAPDGRLRPAQIAAARQQALSLLRFPGGTFSDYYHWRDGIGPATSRPVRPHFTDEGSSQNRFGTPEVARFAHAVGAELLLTVNAGTGSAQEAAEWVRYCNAPVSLERARDGFPSPFGVRYWEVGNELYLPGNPGKIKVAVSPEVYTARYLEYAARMRAVDPNITLLAISSSNASRYPVPNPDWFSVLLAGAAPKIDMIALHNSYFPLIFHEKNPVLRELYQALWAAPEAVKRNLDELTAILERTPDAAHIEFAITEWGALFSFEPTWIDHVKTLGTAVYTARLMQVYLAHPKVQLANYFKLTDPTFMSWVNAAGRAKVPALVFELMNRYRGTELIASSVLNSATYQSRAVGAVAAEEGVPEITTVASRRGETLFLNVINRSWDTIHQVRVLSSELDLSQYRARVHFVASDGVTDHNGPDIPAELNLPLLEPAVSAAAAAAGVQLRSLPFDPTQLLAVQPFSVLTLELSPK